MTDMVGGIVIGLLLGLLLMLSATVSEARRRRREFRRALIDLADYEARLRKQAADGVRLMPPPSTTVLGLSQDERDQLEMNQAQAYGIYMRYKRAMEER